MDKSLEVLLDPDVLTEEYRELQDGYEYPLLDQFWAGTIPNEESLEYSFMYYPAMTTPAPMNSRGGPARILEVGQHEKRFATAHTLFNKMLIDSDLLTCLRNPDNKELQKRGRVTVMQAIDQFGDRQKLAKQLIIAKSLFAGVIYENAEGVILESSSGKSRTVDLLVPANNKTTCNGIIDTPWDDPESDIPLHLDKFRRRAGQLSAEKPTDIWCNEINRNKVIKNDNFAIWAQASNVAPDVVLRGEVIPNLWGYNWHFLSGTYTASDGSTKDFVPTDVVSITPPPGGKWCKRTNHLKLVPNSIGITPTVEGALGMFDDKYGMYVYLRVDADGNIYLHIGDNFGFVFANPNAINIPTVFTATE